MPRDDEELPKKKSKRPRDDEEEADEDEDDRPRKKKKSGGGGGIIPLKNGKALAAYYCGVFSLIPGIGCVLGPVAIVLGIMGFMYANENPEAGGKGHAITGIVVGLVGPFLVGGLIFAVSIFLK